MLKQLTQAGILMLACVFSMTNVLAIELAGKVEDVSGEVWAKYKDQTTRVLKKGVPFYSGDRIRTSRGASVSLRFSDDTKFVLGADSRMVIDKFTKGKTVDAGFATRVLKGTFRFISGLIAKREPRSMRVGITVGTIGIRGTHVAGEVVERHEVNGEIVEASAKITLLEPEEEGEKTSIEVSNEYGSVVIDEPGYGTEIPDEHSPPGPVRKMQIRSIQNIMRAMRSTTRRVNTPKPRMR
jgi:hypothetical protein